MFLCFRSGLAQQFHPRMPKRTLKKFLPQRHHVVQYRVLKPLADLLHDPNLWHLNRRSTSMACLLGFFWAFIPMPLQMLASAACAVVFRCNLPLSVAIVWITNPLTIPPIYFGTYLFGAWLLNEPPVTRDFEMSMAWVERLATESWIPFLVGSVSAGVIFGVLGWASMQLLWRYSVATRWKNRLAQRRARREAEKDQS